MEDDYDPDLTREFNEDRRLIWWGIALAAAAALIPILALPAIVVAIVAIVRGHIGLGAVVIVIAAVAASAGLQRTAEAQAGWRIDRSLAIAQEVWKPSCGELRLGYGDPLAVSKTESAGWAWKDNCTIGIDKTKHLEFEELCTIVLHEAGHVAGAGHSKNPESVMYAEPLVQKVTAKIGSRTIVHWDGIDHRCLKRGRPFLQRHGWL